jgi:integrase
MRNRHRALSDEQVRKLLEGIVDARDKSMIALIINSGLRLGEVANLDRNSIIFDVMSPW